MIYFASGNFLQCFLNDLFLLLLFPLSCLAKSLIALHRNSPIFELWSHHLRVEPLLTLLSKQLCVFGDHAEICSAPTRKCLASLYFDHSITPVSLGFGQSPFNKTLVL